MPAPISTPVAPPLAALVALIILAALSLIGHRFLPAALRPGKAVLRVPLSVSLGTVLVGVSVWVTAWLIGSTAAFFVAFVMLVFALPGAGAWGRDWGRFLGRVGLLLRNDPVLTSAFTVPLVMVAPQLLLPVLSSDALRYHLALPKLYLLTGEVSFYPWDVHAAFPQAAESIYMLALPWGGGEAAKFLHALFFLLALLVLLLLVHGRDRSSRRAAVISAFFFAVTPAALAAAGAAFIDHFVVFHLGVASLLIRHRNGPFLVGCALAGALATKWAAAPGIAALALVVLWQCHRAGRLRRIAWLIIPVVVAISPFAVRNLAATGDPFYPTGYGLVRGEVPGVAAGRFEYVTQVHRDIPGPLGIPWGESVAEVQPDEVVGWHHLLGLILLPLAWRRRQVGPELAIIIAYLGVGLVYHPSVRLSLPLFWALAAVEGRFLASSSKRGWLVVGLLVSAPALITSGKVMWSFGEPAAYLASKLDREEVCRRTIPAFDAAGFVNSRPEDGAVMAMDFPAPYLFDRPWLVEGILNQPPLQQWIHEGATAAELLSRLSSRHIRFLVVTPAYGGGTPYPLRPLARTSAEVGEVAMFRGRLVKLYSQDQVDVFLVPD